MSTQSLLPKQFVFQEGNDPPESGKPYVPLLKKVQLWLESEAKELHILESNDTVQTAQRSTLLQQRRMAV